MLSNVSIRDRVINCVVTALALDPGSKPLSETTELLGNLPEFDSQSVITIMTALEDEFEIIIEDDEVDASLFESVGSLIQFVTEKTVHAV